MSVLYRLVSAASLIYFLAPPSASAQLTKLDTIGKQLAAKFKHGKTRMAVPDFSSTAGSLALQAHYLAWYLSSAIQVHASRHLRVTDHLMFDRDLANIENSQNYSLSPERLLQLSSQLHEDVLIHGTLEKKDSSYVLGMRAVLVPNGDTVDSQSVEIDASPFLESLSIPLQPLPGQSLNPPAVNGIKMPSCTYTPDPSYTDLGRANKVNGTVVMGVIISPEGHIHQIHPLRLLGYALDEQAYNTVKTWSCNPVHNKDGTPIPVVAPVEVTFRIY